MTFDIDPTALERMAAQQSPAWSINDEYQKGGSISSGRMSSTGFVHQDLLPSEARLPIRLSLLSFEEDWSAPGMDAYDAL